MADKITLKLEGENADIRTADVAEKAGAVNALKEGLINGGETAIRFEESNFTDEEIKQIEEFANK